jgi:hypothetical protein
MPDENKKQSTTSPAADWKKEEAYWREQHSQQPYADKGRSYDDYATAYQVGVEGVGKYPGRSYPDIEDSLALDYEHAGPASALPWDRARPAVKAAWEKLVMLPREPDRGIRDFI